MAEQAKQHNPTGLSDRDEVAYLNALDPHATTTTKPWELELTSKFLRKVAVGWIVVVMAVHVFMSWAVDAEFTGVSITNLDKFARRRPRRRCGLAPSRRRRAGSAPLIR